jgi:F-type H+-transporting ATPase subunit b
MEIEPIQILLQVINFGLVAFVLMKLLYKPVAKVLEERAQKIKEGLDAAESNLAEKDKMDAQVKAEIAKARKDATKILADAKKQAETEAAAIVAAAKEQAKKAGESEKVAYETMLSEAKVKAEKDLKSLVTATTAQVLKNGLSDSDQNRIIDSQIKVIKDAKFES